MGIKFTGSSEKRPMGKNAKYEPQTIRDLADIVQEKEKKSGNLEKKTMLTLRIDPDLVQFFKAGGMGWQTRINAVLRKHVEQQIHG